MTLGCSMSEFPSSLVLSELVFLVLVYLIDAFLLLFLLLSRGRSSFVDLIWAFSRL